VPEGKKVLLYLGRLHPKKGLKELVQAWSIRSKTKGRDWALAIIGWDQAGFQFELESSANVRGLDSIYFLGPRFGGEKHAAFAKADAFILPSHSEGLPMVVLEAWANSRPVLATDACNLEIGFSRGAEWRITPTVDGIVAGLDWLFNAEPSSLNSMGLKGRTLAAERFSWNEVSTSFTQVYSWLEGRGSRPDCVQE
jgi:poly(glycerol-phosphate) alpha-glucosyltransferase